MKKVSIRDFQLRATDYLDDLPLVLTRYNIPIAKVTSLQEKVRTPSVASVQAVSEADINEIAQTYKVPLTFVKLEYEQLTNYCASSGKRYKDYKAALRSWVLRDMKRQIERRTDVRPSIDARGLSK
jgi:hypothetical protein